MMERPRLPWFIVPAVVVFFALGIAWAREPVGGLVGLCAGLVSASFWGLGAVSGPRWNAALNLFAALAAAGSLGFLAPVDRVCSWHQLPLLCR